MLLSTVNIVLAEICKDVRFSPTPSICGSGSTSPSTAIPSGIFVHSRRWVSTSSQLDEKVADPHYRHGPGQPLSSTLARRVRVQPLLLFPLLFVRRVRGHSLHDLIKGPWPLLWGRGEMAEHWPCPARPLSEGGCVVSLFPLSYNVIFSFSLSVV